MDKEIWKDVKGYEGFYQVSNVGRVKSLNYHRGKEEKALKLCKNPKGYFIVCLSKENTIKNHRVHRLVAAAFISNPENKETVNHKDGDKLNNRSDNLEWNTQKENIKHSGG